MAGRRESASPQRLAERQAAGEPGEHDRERVANAAASADAGAAQRRSRSARTTAARRRLPVAGDAGTGFRAASPAPPLRVPGVPGAAQPCPHRPPPPPVRGSARPASRLAASGGPGVRAPPRCAARPPLRTRHRAHTPAPRPPRGAERSSGDFGEQPRAAEQVGSPLRARRDLGFGLPLRPSMRRSSMSRSSALSAIAARHASATGWERGVPCTTSRHHCSRISAGVAENAASRAQASKLVVKA